MAPPDHAQSAVFFNFLILFACVCAQVYCYSISCAQDNEIRYYLVGSIAFTALALLNTVALGSATRIKKHE